MTDIKPRMVDGEAVCPEGDGINSGCPSFRWHRDRGNTAVGPCLADNRRETYWGKRCFPHLLKRNVELEAAIGRVLKWCERDDGRCTCPVCQTTAPCSHKCQAVTEFRRALDGGTPNEGGNQ